MGLLSIPLLFVIVGYIWGGAVQKIISDKGYQENWFWWGFFFGLFAWIAAWAKPAVYPPAAASPVSPLPYDRELPETGGWICSCGRVNPSYTGTCACGKTKREIEEANLTQAKRRAERQLEREEIEKLNRVKAYKEFLDAGVITQEEYEAKRKEILG